MSVIPLYNNLDKKLKEKNFEITKKITSKIDKVEFFKNVKFDTDLKKIKEIEKEIEWATNLIIKKEYKRAERMLKSLLPEAQELKRKTKIINKINRKLEDCKFLPRYYDFFENYYKEQNKEKSEELNNKISLLKAENIQVKQQLQEKEKYNKKEQSSLLQKKQEIETKLKNKEQELKEITEKNTAEQAKLLKGKEILVQQLRAKETELKNFVTKKSYNKVLLDKQEIEKQLQAKETELKNTVKNDKAVYDKLLAQKTKLEQKNTQIDKEISNLNKQLTEKQAKITLLEKEVNKYKTEIQKLKNPPKPKPPKTNTGNNFTEKLANTSFDMIFVKEGTFKMGGDKYGNEKPIHSVNVKNFFIAKHQVTQKLWKEIMGNNPSNFKDCDNCPVENVSLDDAK